MGYKVFFAWQSQKKDINKFLKEQLKKTKNKLKEDNSIDIEIIYSPTQNDSGSPNIVDKIKEQIYSSDVFIGDITPIDDNNCISNSNVMYELGLAEVFMGESRVILLLSKDIDIKNMAFDINHKRISTFNIKDKNFYKYLSEWVFDGIKESEKQNFKKQYFCQKIINHMEILYNNLLRFIYTNEYKYEENYKNISVEEIENYIKKGEYSIFQITVNYTNMLEDINSSIQNLYTIVENKLILSLIRLSIELKRYIDLKEISKINVFECINGKTKIYNFMYREDFLLKDFKNYDFENPIYFRNDLVFIGEMPDKPIKDVFLTNSIKVLETIDTEKRYNMSLAELEIYKFINNDAVEKYSICIFNLLNEMNNILSILNMEARDNINAKESSLVKFFNINNFDLKK